MLGVLVMLQNEAHTIAEFVQHYLEEEADHVFIADDNSTDRLRESLACVDPAAYTVWPTSQLLQGRARAADLFRRQKQVYPAAIERIRRDYGAAMEWLLVVDVDEFVVSRACPRRTVGSLLRHELHAACDAVFAPWLMFSWGSQAREPCGHVRTALTWRWGLDRAYKRPQASVRSRSRKLDNPQHRVAHKYAVRLSRLAAAGVHSATLREAGGPKRYCAPERRSGRLATRPSKPSSFSQLREAAVPALVLATHHYRIRSQDQWERKTRGGYDSGKYGDGSVEDSRLANRLDVHDEFMRVTRVRAPLRFDPSAVPRVCSSVRPPDAELAAALPGEPRADDNVQQRVSDSLGSGVGSQIGVVGAATVLGEGRAAVDCDLRGSSARV